MNLFNLFATISLNKSNFDNGIKDVTKQAQSLGSKLSVAFKNTAKVITGVATTITAVAAAFTAVAKKAIDFGDDIDKSSQKLGLSASAYQKWALAFTQYGADNSTLSRAMQNLIGFSQDLAKGDGEALLALQDLGIGYEDFMAMDNDEKMMAIVNALQGVEDKTKKAELAQKIFGDKIGLELMPMLNDEQGSLNELFKSYEDLGLIMSDDLVKASAELSDKFAILGQKFKVTGATILSDFYPQISLIIDGLMAIGTNSEEAGEKLGQGISEMIIKLARSLPDFVAQIKDLLFSIVKNTDWYNVAKSIGKAIIEAIGALLDSDFYKELIDAGWEFSKGLIDGIIQGFKNVKWLDLILGFFTPSSTTSSGAGGGAKGRASGGMLTKMANGGSFAGYGTQYLVGEAGAEIVAQGRYGTGVANVQQIADAQFEAMEQYGIKEAIYNAVEGIVNGFATVMRNNTADTNIVVRLGDKDFKTEVLRATNEGLMERGRKSLNTISRY